MRQEKAITSLSKWANFCVEAKALSFRLGRYTQIPPTDAADELEKTLQAMSDLTDKQKDLFLLAPSGVEAYEVAKEHMNGWWYQREREHFRQNGWKDCSSINAADHNPVLVKEVHD